MLIVLAASWFVKRLITETRLCVFTSKRTGPFGEEPVLGRNAKFPLIAMLLSWFEYEPVVKVKFAGLAGSPGGILPSASPVALNPVSAIGLIFTVVETVS